jgi:hypothetical protein
MTEQIQVIHKKRLKNNNQNIQSLKITGLEPVII